MQYPHWQYYLSLSEDVERLSRYVSLIEDNYQTSSIECTLILLSASSEVDVVFKLLCEGVSPGCNPKNIEDYGNIILDRFPLLKTTVVVVGRCGLSFQPWGHWTKTHRPKWWQDYQKVKHQRHEHADLGNLKNALYAVAGLCVLVSYLYYFDFLHEGLGIRRPFIFLDRLYDGAGKMLFSPAIFLEDLETYRSQEKQ